MSVSKLMTCCASAPILALLAFGVAHAESSSSGGADAPVSQVEEVVVTALKRATTVQNTPLAITALTDQSLSKMGASTVADFVRTVPGLNLTESDSGRTRISIRGVQTAGESTVGLYYGETPLTGPAGTTSDPSGATPNLNLFDVERVEVLRGPQGTLYGSGSMGGTLRVIFKPASTTQYEGATDFSATSVNGGGIGYGAKGMVNVPLIQDKLGARLDLYQEQRAGYVDNVVLHNTDINKAQLQGGRLMLNFTPTEDFSLTAMALLQKQDIGDTSQWRASLGPYKTDIPIRQPFHDNLQLYNVTGRYDLHFATLTGVASYYKWNVESTNDNTATYTATVNKGTYCSLYFHQAGSCTAGQLASYKTWALSNMPIAAYQPRFVENKTLELRLSSNGSGPLSYTIGAFHEDRNDRVDTMVSPADPTTGLIKVPAVDLGSRYIVDFVKQTAYFGELSYTPIDPLTLTVGARHYSYKKTVGGQYLGYSYYNGQTPSGYFETEADASGWVQKYNAQYKVTHDIMTYVQATQGFRPGGANNIPDLPASLHTYAPDSLWNYEAGVKTAWFSRRLTINADVYQVDWNNLQTSVQTTNGSFSFISNVGKAQINGFELEVAAYPIPGLSLTGTLSTIDARLTADQVSEIASAAGKSGDRLTYIPDRTMSASAEYTWPVFGELNALVRADYTYTGRMTTEFRPTNVNYRRVGRYNQVNLRTGIQGTGWAAYLYANNVFDTVGITRISASTSAPDYDVSIAPRTVGVNLTKSF
ncbi:TonB-dependent receptor [Phenylobacterium hankyongense]|uniref:TonB-dependent receptor n=1 Tax=Phenylobacterium hankyongense TaxID=1813876 RepID=A0A328AZ27_9CAUL|nr:TonB-dependent receptor [Phenylobacterium hankyongense]RAK59441.1 TonB-dependent receptor [Phenylobacterium hankyongense]